VQGPPSHTGGKIKSSKYAGQSEGKPPRRGKKVLEKQGGRKKKIFKINNGTAIK